MLTIVTGQCVKCALLLSQRAACQSKDLVSRPPKPWFTGAPTSCTRKRSRVCHCSPYPESKTYRNIHIANAGSHCDGTDGKAGICISAVAPAARAATDRNRTRVGRLSAIPGQAAASLKKTTVHDACASAAHASIQTFSPGQRQCLGKQDLKVEAPGEGFRLFS